MNTSTVGALIAFSLAWWLGTYALGRDPRNPQLRFVGLGLITYALALAAVALAGAVPEPGLSSRIASWHYSS